MNPQNLMYFIIMTSSMSFALIAPTVPLLIIKNGGTSTISGLIFSLFALSQSITLSFSPIILKKFGRKESFYISLIIQVLIIFLYSILDKLNTFFFYILIIIFRIVHGIFDGIIMLIVFSITTIINKSK